MVTRGLEDPPFNLALILVTPNTSNSLGSQFLELLLSHKDQQADGLHLSHNLELPCTRWVSKETPMKAMVKIPPKFFATQYLAYLDMCPFTNFSETWNSFLWHLVA